ncbi:hypothetical protein DPMN_112500 [Dreissena polymorpha]|uniref:Uncharacterized protein n=1 Tax=Dreissena polymorpha TaxID=45954 RepID=A0A9D4KFU3_DREPO|nr:hypothetical protein DPMN_112500 [Dreissena polymorpha]
MRCRRQLTCQWRATQALKQKDVSRLSKGYRVGLSVARDATLKGMQKAYRLYLPRILGQRKPSYRRTSSSG